ncbi:cobalt-zinc-cadmium efflux system outer membrane protein [Chitinophaga polysaccharea]|uniref:Cobalt-zinc-cadmium efflux system outer membrane protein n=1 Tax=Chitinophaga polysaccharea TaxID=1293035 RepID=A0A561PPD7_9BACT|nr:TolC family protein [Chitinophaga polysaccharea]TWF39975.1 cobalt-zinc-cadmium efflux system outer membrane protein [Chitinophaga polysaccharea]
MAMRYGNILLLLFLALQGNGQTKDSLIYPRFLAEVTNNNLAYAAERFNVNLATARVAAAKVFPDPSLSFGWVDNGQKRMKMGYGFNTSVSWLLELGNKRQARSSVALSQLELTHLLLENYYRNLQADATLAYLQAILQENLLTVTRESYQSMSLFARADSIRFQLGEIKAVDARQSKLEAANMLNTVYRNEATFKAALLQLGMLMGKSSDTLYYPAALKSSFDREFSLKDLIDAAISHRADILAAGKDKEVAHNLVKLAQANRMPDLGLALGMAQNSGATNVIAPTPSTNVISAGISIPLKFSGRSRAELLSAQYSAAQAAARYQQAALQVQTEVATSYYNYLAARKQVNQFHTGILEDAEKALAGKIYSYRSGEINLLEVLNAQRTYNSLKQSYYEALNGYAAALVEMERTAGIWDINL